MVDRYTPIFRIEIDGIDESRKIWMFLQSLTFEDAESGEADSFEISISNTPAFVIPRHGAKVKLWLGFKETRPEYVGAFEVDETSIDLKPAIMRVRGRSAGFSKGTVKQKEDIQWEGLSLKEIAEKIGAKHGHKVKVDVDVQYTSVAQAQESDISFLQRLANSVGANFAIRDNTIIIAKPDQASRAQVTIHCNEVIEGTLTIKDRPKHKKIRASYWDLKEATSKSVEAQTDDDVDATHEIKKQFNSMSEAKTAAEIQASRLHRGGLQGRLTLPGNPGLVAGAEATLSGFTPDAVNGKYIIQSTSHTISKSGWVTSVNLGDGEKSGKRGKTKKATMADLKEK